MSAFTEPIISIAEIICKESVIAKRFFCLLPDLTALVEDRFGFQASRKLFMGKQPLAKNPELLKRHAIVLQGNRMSGTGSMAVFIGWAYCANAKPPDFKNDAILKFTAADAPSLICSNSFFIQVFFKIQYINFAKMENRRGKQNVGPAVSGCFQEMLHGSSAARGDDRNFDRFADSSD
jgi:hypothetical protein